MLLAKAAQASLNLFLPSRTDRKLAQVSQEGYRGVVLAGLLGGDQRLHLAPGLGLTPGHRGEMAFASLDGFTFLPVPLAGGALGLSPSPLLGTLLGGREELADGTPSGCRIGGERSAGVAEAADELGAEVWFSAVDEPREQRGPLRLG